LLARELPLDPSPVDGGTVLDDLMNIVKNFPDETPNGRLALSCIEADVCKTNRKFASLQHLTAFFKIYNICALLHRSELNICRILDC
jgi:hypothetical protein